MRARYPEKVHPIWRESAPVSPHEIYAAQQHRADAQHRLDLLAQIASYLASGLTRDYVARDRVRSANILAALRCCSEWAETIRKETEAA